MHPCIFVKELLAHDYAFNIHPTSAKSFMRPLMFRSHTWSKSVHALHAMRVLDDQLKTWNFMSAPLFIDAKLLHVATWNLWSTLVQIRNRVPGKAASPTRTRTNHKLTLRLVTFGCPKCQIGPLPIILSNSVLFLPTLLNLIVYLSPGPVPLAPPRCSCCRLQLFMLVVTWRRSSPWARGLYLSRTSSRHRSPWQPPSSAQSSASRCRYCTFCLR